MKKIVLSAAVALLLIGCGDQKESHATQEQSKATTSVAEMTKSVTHTTQKAVVAAAATPAADGVKIFKVCSSCHGANAQNHALGKSQIIKGWAASKTVDALKGYKAGTYGGVMKAVMKGQASKLSDADMKAVADYISKL